MSQQSETIEALKKATESKVADVLSSPEKGMPSQVPSPKKINIKKLEAECRKKIRLFIKSGHENGEKSDTEYIHNIYDEIASQFTPGNNKNDTLVKSFMNNQIDYTASAPLGKWIEENVKKESLPDAKIRRKLLIDQFTRLNTKPILDPFLERIISTFWPEADSVPYKRAQPKTISKETIIKTTLYPTLPTIHLNPDDNIENTNGDKANNYTYGSKIMTLTEKVNGDQSDYDTLGVEMFINTLMTTGSNLSFKPVDLKMEEEYKVDEKLSNVANIPQEDDDDDDDDDE